MTFVCKWLLSFEMAFLKFLSFSRWEGGISALGRLSWVEPNGKTLISCLSSGIWLFDFSSLFSLRLFLPGKKERKGGGCPQTKDCLPFFF